MKPVNISWLFWIALILLALGFGKAYATEYGTTACDEWANFTKIITFKFRDVGYSNAQVKEELLRVMGQNNEISTALVLVDYTYTNDKLDAEAIWHGVYEGCNAGRK